MLSELARDPTFAYDIYYMNKSGITCFLFNFIQSQNIYVSDIASIGSAFLGSRLGVFA